MLSRQYQKWIRLRRKKDSFSPNNNITFVTILSIINTANTYLAYQSSSYQNNDEKQSISIVKKKDEKLNQSTKCSAKSYQTPMFNSFVIKPFG